jgi:hypothetical protein
MRRGLKGLMGAGLALALASPASAQVPAPPTPPTPIALDPVMAAIGCTITCTIDDIELPDAICRRGDQYLSHYRTCGSQTAGCHRFHGGQEHSESEIEYCRIVVGGFVIECFDNWDATYTYATTRHSARGCRVVRQSTGRTLAGCDDDSYNDDISGDGFHYSERTQRCNVGSVAYRCYRRDVTNPYDPGPDPTTTRYCRLEGLPKPGG